MISTSIGNQRHLLTISSDNLDEPTFQKSAGKRLTYTILHSISGRLRLRVQELKEQPHCASWCLLKLANLSGVHAVKTNYWCASVIIDFDPITISQAQILEFVDAMELRRDDTEHHALARPSFLGSIANKVLSWLDRTMPAAVQLGLGAAAFLAAACRLPSLVTRVLLAASIAPIARRALHTLVEEKKAGVDALDGIAAALMLVNGKIVEASFMTALIGLGEFIREMTARRCEKLVSDLLGLSGQFAWLVKGKKRICIPANEVKVGDIIVVYPGELVPVDGQVISGEAAIDQSKLTGESIPVEVGKGDHVLAATVAVEGKIYVQCEATGSHTRAGMVLESIASAPLHETKIQNYASLVADKMVIPIMLSAACCFAVTKSLVRLMSMLIFDFTTGIRIAAPTAVLACMYRAGQRGILVKSGAALEKLATINAIVFDKTGTLTSGEPKITRVIAIGIHSDSEILQLAASVEQRLHHPASRAIVRYALSQNLTIPDRSTSIHLRGMGVRAEVDGMIVSVGSKRMMEQEKVDTRSALVTEAEITQNGESLAYVAINGQLAGVIGYHDPLRNETAQALRQLRKLGITKMVMATGDSETAAHGIARQCGIEEVSARAFPEQKAELVKQLKEAGYIVAVVGDGINDSPALAHADVAVSLHGGTEAARHSASVVLTDDDLRRLPEAIQSARSAMQLVRQNLSLAVIPNSTGLGLAAFGLVGPAGATLLNNGSAICAALNSLRPLYFNNGVADPEAAALKAKKS